MRSNSYIKKSLVFLFLVVPLTLKSSDAHAAKNNFFQKMISSFVSAFNGDVKAASAKLKDAPFVEAQVSPQSQVQTTVNELKVTIEPVDVPPSTPSPATKSPGEQFIANMQDFIKSANASSYGSLDLRKGSQISLDLVDKVNTDSHTEIITEYTEKGLTFHLRYDDVAVKNPQLLLKDFAILSKISTLGQLSFSSSNYFLGDPSHQVKSEIESPHAIAELLTNAREGSVTANARWLKLQILILKDVYVKSDLLQALGVEPDYLSTVTEKLKSQLPEAELAAERYAKKQQKILDQWKIQTKTLDSLEDMQSKLDDLILNNDRKGVRQMLESYLPWTVMEPVEAKTWKIWLEAIEHPDQAKSTVAFRGLKYDTDKIQRRQTAQGEVFGFMSTVLTKNQGNYTRRLRSLSTNRQKNGDIGLQVKNSTIMSVKIADQMTAHAKNPVASSFISFTYDPRVAYRFMGQNQQKVIKNEPVSVPYGGILVVKVDSRRMVPNIPSMYSNEIELLAPLIIFPDEVVAYKEGNFDHIYTFEKFVTEISQKTGINFSSWRNEKNSTEMNLQERYNKEGFTFLKEITDLRSTTKSCGNVFSL